MMVNLDVMAYTILLTAQTVREVETLVLGSSTTKAKYSSCNLPAIAWPTVSPAATVIQLLSECSRQFVPDTHEKSKLQTMLRG